MKILVLGNGAREHAVCLAFSRSKRINGLYCAPGNAATAELGQNLDLNCEDPAAVSGRALELGVDLVFIGPEAPLAAGVADACRAAGLQVFGPGREAAQLESSKSLAREFTQRHGIPCARSQIIKKGQRDQLKRALDEHKRKRKGQRLVLKKSGLAAGKGVLETSDLKEALAFGLEVLESDSLVLEEYLTGWELSLFALCDEHGHLCLPPCADHKKALAGDMGPNTGGMGAICPVPQADAALLARIEREIVAPSFAGMGSEGLAYRGVLFFGIMVTAEGPRLLEYNVRFGDPETQSLLSLLESDFTDLAEAVAQGRLAGQKPRFAEKCAVGVVVAAPGYPGPYPKGLLVQERDGPQSGQGLVFHANTSRDAEGGLRTGGGRCFTAVAVAEDLYLAHSEACKLAKGIEFEGAWFRPDIGRRYYSGEIK